MLVIYFLCNHFKLERTAKAWLVLASFYFYSFFNPSYLFIIISSIIFNYGVGWLLHNRKFSDFKRQCIAGLGVLFNLGLLAYFKYYDFFVDNVNAFFGSNIALLNILLPLGISFFTFQQISFVIDSYKRSCQKYDFLSYCLFVSFFPQLIAGPIVLPSEMLPQFKNHENKKINYENLNRGLYLFCIGLAKKIVIADSIAVFAKVGFDVEGLESLTFCEAWLTSLSYTLQLYFDFSGYCDMAMGIALMFNILLPINFNSPYKAVNFQDFWKRWHMTLGRFMTNYLYIPLGGNRKGFARTLVNLLIVFLISGIWHGAGWTFLIWGGLHGMAILTHRVWRGLGLRMPSILGWAITLFFVNIFWVVFRAGSLPNAWKVIGAMFDISSINQVIRFEYKGYASFQFDNIPNFCIFLSSIFIVLFCKPSIERVMQSSLGIGSVCEQTVYFLLSVVLLNRVADFLYWNF